jgi:F-type H+-transporting ATPase subunit b
MELVNPDIGTIFWMTLMFIIVLVILKKYAWKPILNALERRERSIKDALMSAERARAEMEKVKADNEKVMAKARKERDAILKETRKMSENLLNEAKGKAGDEAKKIIEAAREQIKNEKSAAISEIHNQVAELSVDIAEKILREKLKTNQEQQDLIEKLLNEIKLN